jgi:pimeloyl-ACP methyl ester carboxylesterase
MSSADSSAQTYRWFRPIAAGVIIFSVLLMITGAAYQSISMDRDRRAHPMPGQFIDVGGYEMHIDCLGQGTPTVILDSGLGDSYISWRKVQPRIAQFTRVCSYDRAGLGYSDSSPRPRTSKDIAEELHLLLHKARIPPPYLLVGHSMGGFNVRLYANLYRNEVAGMVLVDSSHPEQQNRFPPALNDLDASWRREEEFLEFAMPFGVPRLLGFCGKDPEVRAAECNFHNVQASVAELKSIAESAGQTKSAGSLGDMPLTVVSQDPDTPQYDLPEDLVRPTNDAWQQMQRELAQLSTRGTQVMAQGSAHYIQLDRPDVVIEALRKILDQVRQAQSGS